jgi:hypothetical protein
MDTLSEPGPARQVGNGFRWSQLIIGVICMVMIGRRKKAFVFS